MIIQVETRDEDGNITFNGKLNTEEVSFVLNVGLNYLMAQGAMPMFSGDEGHDVAKYGPTTATAQ